MQQGNGGAVMMRLCRYIIIVALCISTSALADIRTLVNAVETDPLFLNVPTTFNSRLSFKPCEDCDYVSARLTPATTYSLDGAAMEFADFRRGFSSRGHRSDGYALVLIDTETNTVQSIEVAN